MSMTSKFFLALVFMLLILVAGEALDRQTAAAQCLQLFPGGDGVFIPCPPEDESVPLDPNADYDGDGVPEGVDNCPGINNADQSDTWGDARGDACDTSGIENNSDGTTAFWQEEGLWAVYGDCFVDSFSNTQCKLLAHLNYCGLPIVEDQSVYVDNPSPDSSQQILVTHMSSNEFGRVYQVNVHNTDGYDVQQPMWLFFPLMTCADTDDDWLHINFDDYCPGVFGFIGGCPDLASYYAAVNARFGFNLTVNTTTSINSDTDNDGFPDSIDQCPSQSGSDFGCPEEALNTDVLIPVDGNSGEPGDLEFNPSNGTPPPIQLDIAYCEVIFFQHPICQQYAVGVSNVGPGARPGTDYPSMYHLCLDQNYNRNPACSIPFAAYCAVLPSNREDCYIEN